MKRSAALLVAVLVAASILVFLPLGECPDCRGAALGINGYAPGCPRCGDAGRVSLFLRWTRRDLDPDLATLVRFPTVYRISDPPDFPAALGRLLQRSGIGPLDVGEDCIGSVVFAADDPDRLPVALLRPRSRKLRGSKAAVVLFDRDGRVLDHREVWYWVGPVGIDAELRRSGAVDIVVMRLPREFPIQLGRGKVVTEIPADRVSLVPRGGRLEIASDSR